MNFPRYMFAIGGAGKNLVYTTLEKEWIIREILKPQFSPTEVDITIIDTATIEENRDREKITEIEKNIERIEEEYRSNSINTGQNIGRINIVYKLLTKEMNLQSPYALIGIEDKVKKATGATTWWINDSELGDEWTNKVMSKENFQELNFSKGVYRKRAIGKAIYYKAISEGLFKININRSAQIDIITGLGGGTGSGIALDLAKKLKVIQPTADIALFGILSTLNESPDEKANNFAALGEIEHAFLNGKSPFKEVILIPMEITEFPGREQASDIHEELLREFDETVPHIFVAYHNNQAERLFTGFPDFSPFIIATSQLVRYNVESIKKLKDDLIEALNDKDTSLKNEEDLYSAIRKFIDEFYPEEFQNNLSDDDKSFIKDRLSKFNSVLEHALFQELNYNGVILLKKVVEDGIRGSGSEDIEKQISGIKAETDMISVGSEGYKEETDKILYDMLKKDIDLINESKDVLNLVNNNVKDDLIRETLKIIIKVDEDRSRNKLNKIREEISKLNSKRKQLDGNIKILGEEKKSYLEKVGNQIEKSNGEWKQTESNNIAQLKLIDEVVPTIVAHVNNLKLEIGEYASRLNKINNAKTVGIEPIGTIEDLLNKIDSDLGKIGIYYDNKAIIMRNLNNAKEFRRAQIEFGQNIPFLDKLLRTRRVAKAKDAKNRTMLKIAELNSDRIFEVKGSSISGVYNYDVESRATGRKDEIINKIINRLKDKDYFQNAEPELFDNLKELLMLPEKRRDADIKEIVRSHIGFKSDINKIESNLDEKRSEIARVSRDFDVFKALEILITKTIKDILGNHARSLKSYHEKISNIGKDVKAMHKAKKNTIRYIMEIQPTNIYKATITGANINNILEDQGEDITLRQNLRDAANRTVDVRYNMLVRRIIENESHDKRWARSKVLSAFVTIANIDLAVINAGDIVVNAFDIDRESRSEWKCPFGDAWGAGMVLFVTGVPLDNIRSVTDPSAGYYRHYKDEDNNSIFLHHSYMLEEGKYIKRKTIFNIEQKTDRDLLLQDDNAVEQLYSQNFEEKRLSDIYK
jgi:hypothetical protein